MGSIAGISSVFSCSLTNAFSDKFCWFLICFSSVNSTNFAIFFWGVGGGGGEFAKYLISQNYFIKKKETLVLTSSLKIINHLSI